MTKAEQFQKAADAIIAEYRRECPSVTALYQKAVDAYKIAVDDYTAKREEYDRASGQASAERDAVRAEARAEQDQEKRDRLRQKAKAMLENWLSTQARYAVPRDEADAALVHASRYINLAAYPLAYLQAVSALKIYQAYFAVYDKVESIPKDGTRAETIREYVKQITGGSGWPGSIKISTAEVSADPYPWHGNATKETTARELASVEERRAKCLKTEPEILDRLQLIEQARQQLETFKNTYEKSLRALLNIMDGMSERTKTREFFNDIQVF